MGDIAQFGIEIPPVKGGKEAEESFHKISKAAEGTDKAVAGSSKAFSQYSLGVLSAMRSLSPFGGEVERMALGLERAAARMQRMSAVTADMTTAQNAAIRAVQAGIATDTSRASILQGVTRAEQALTAATAEKVAALRAATVAGNAAAAATRLQSQVEQNFGSLAMSGAQRNALLKKTTDEATAARRAYIAGVASSSAATQAEKAAVEDLNKARQAEQATMRLATGGLSGLIAVAGAVIVVLSLLVAAIYAVRKAWGFMMDGIKEAARLQATTTTFKLLVGNAGLAANALKQLKEVADKTGGIFDDEEIIKGATVLEAAGVHVKNVGTYMLGLSVLADRAGVSVEQMSQAWVQAIKGRVTSSTIEGNTIMRQLGETTGKTGKELREAMQKGAIGSRQFTAALIEAAKHTDELATRQGDFATQQKILVNTWNDVKKAFAEPIFIALTPLLREMGALMRQLVPIASLVGTAVSAGLVTAIVSIKEVVDGLSAAFKELGRLAGGFEKIFNSVKAIVNAAAAMHIPGAGLAAGAISVGEEFGTAAAKTIEDNAKLKDGASGLMSTFQDLDDIMDKTRDTTNDFSGDLKVLIDYWKDYTEAQAFSTDATSRNWHVQEALQKAIKGLGDPIKDVERLLPGLSPDQAALARWMALEEQIDRTIKNSEMRMKAGMASIGEIVDTGLTKMSRSWGTWQEQVSNSIGDIGNALASGISSGLTDILMGTKSVKEGFRDMALGIIRDIENIILKMLVQLAIQQLIAAAGGGGAGNAFAASVAMSVGGGVPGSGRGDKVHALLEPGEFVIPRDQAQRFGYDKLEGIRKMAGGGQVQRMAGGGGAGIVVIPPGFFNDQTSYGPTSPGATGADRREFTGINDISLRGGDAAIQAWAARRFGLSAGDYFMYEGVRYRYADNPNRRVGNVLDIYFGRGGGRRLGADRNPFGRGGGFRSRLPGDPLARRLGFGRGGRDSQFEFGEFSANRGGFDMGGMDRGSRPGIGGSDFVGPGQIYVGGVPQIGPGGTNEFMAPGGAIFEQVGPGQFVQVSGPNMGITDQSLPAGATPVTGGRGGDGSGGTFYPRGSVGFGIPGGIGFSTAGSKVGGGLGGTFFDRMTNRAFRAGMISRPDAITKFAQSLGHYHPLGAYRGSFRGGRYGGGEGSRFGPNRRAMSTFHAGGVVPLAAGGEVPIMAKGGEGVFTPAQMRAMAPAGTSNQNQVNITITNVNGRTDAGVDSAGTDPAKARELARLVVAVVQSQMVKERRVGGQLYVPRSQRGS